MFYTFVTFYIENSVPTWKRCIKV